MQHTSRTGLGGHFFAELKLGLGTNGDGGLGWQGMPRDHRWVEVVMNGGGVIAVLTDFTDNAKTFTKNTRTVGVLFRVAIAVDIRTKGTFGRGG